MGDGARAQPCLCAGDAPSSGSRCSARREPTASRRPRRHRRRRARRLAIRRDPASTRVRGRSHPRRRRDPRALRSTAALEAGAGGQMGSRERDAGHARADRGGRCRTTPRRRAVALDADATTRRLEDGTRRRGHARRHRDRRACATARVLRGSGELHAAHATTMSRGSRDGSLDCDPGASVAIIGGGFIGAEVATLVEARGLRPVVLEAAERPLIGVLGQEVSAWLARLAPTRVSNCAPTSTSATSSRRRAFRRRV